MKSKHNIQKIKFFKNQAGKGKLIEQDKAVYSQSMMFSYPTIEEPSCNNDTLLDGYLIEDQSAIGTFKKKILELVSQYKLTKDELLSFIKNKDKKNSESLNLYFETILKLKMIQIVDGVVAPIFKHKLDLESWNTISRSQSIRWFQNETNLSSFFSRPKRIYNLLFPKKSYNRIYTPQLNEMQVDMNGEIYDMFSSNDYLGLSKSKRVIQATQDTLANFGLGSGGSRILSGSTPVHRQLEQCIANFKGCEDAIVFSSGFLTNLALMSLLRKDCVVFYDSLIHTSLLEGIKLSQIKAQRFKHNDVKDLTKYLEQYKDHQHKIVLTEGIFSMDGDIAPIDEIVRLSKKYNAYLAIDEAHSFGTLGRRGFGVSDYFNLEDDAIDFKVGTLGKAIGAKGGYIAGKKHMIDLLRYSANTYLFSTSLPSCVMAGAKEALMCLKTQPDLVANLQENAKYLREAIEKMGFCIGLSQSHIIPIIVGCEKKAGDWQARLEKKGCLCSLVTFPAVPKNKARLRICISASHTKAQLNSLLDALSNLDL